MTPRAARIPAFAALHPPVCTPLPHPHPPTFSAEPRLLQQQLQQGHVAIVHPSLRQLPPLPWAAQEGVEGTPPLAQHPGPDDGGVGGALRRVQHLCRVCQSPVLQEGGLHLAQLLLQGLAAAALLRLARGNDCCCRAAAGALCLQPVQQAQQRRAAFALGGWPRALRQVRNNNKGSTHVAVVVAASTISRAPNCACAPANESFTSAAPSRRVGHPQRPPSPRGRPRPTISSSVCAMPTSWRDTATCSSELPRASTRLLSTAARCSAGR